MELSPVQTCRFSISMLCVLHHSLGHEIVRNMIDFGMKADACLTQFVSCSFIA